MKYKELEKNLYKYDENGRCIIDVVINDEDSIMSPFSGCYPTVSGEFSEFIESRITRHHIKHQATINIISDEIDDEEKKLYSQAIKNNYFEKYIDCRKEMIRDFIISGIMLLIGAVVLTVALIMDSLNRNLLLLEIYDIVAWVFIWEAVDVVFFKRTLTNLHRKKYYCLMNANITFQNKTNK